MDCAPFRLVVADTGRRTMLVIDGESSKILAEIPLGNQYTPTVILAGEPHTVHILAAANASNAGALLSLALTPDFTLSSPVPLPSEPVDAAFDAANHALFIAADTGLCRVDLTTEEVVPLKIPTQGKICGLTLCHDALFVACAQTQGGILVMLDAEGKTAGIWETAGVPTHLAATPDGHSLLMPFTANRFTGEGVAVFSFDAGGTLSAPTVIHLKCSGNPGFRAYPCHIAFSPDGKTAYIVNEDCATISLVDLPHLTVAGCIPVGRSVSELHLNPSGTIGFATSNMFADITLIDMVNGKMLGITGDGREILGRMALVPS